MSYNYVLHFERDFLLTEERSSLEISAITCNSQHILSSVEEGAIVVSLGGVQLLKIHHRNMEIEQDGCCIPFLGVNG